MYVYIYIYTRDPSCKLHEAEPCMQCRTSDRLRFIGWCHTDLETRPELTSEIVLRRRVTATTEHPPGELRKTLPRNSLQKRGPCDFRTMSTRSSVHACEARLS